MLRNDEKLRDIRSRCIRAKEELSANLHTRLGWMLFVQRQLSEVDSRLVLQNENLRRLRRHFDLLRQLHRAPTVYLRSMVEIVRRKHFANKFVEWAETLSGTVSYYYLRPSNRMFNSLLLLKDILGPCTKMKLSNARDLPRLAKDIS